MCNYVEEQNPYPNILPHAIAPRKRRVLSRKLVVCIFLQNALLGTRWGLHDPAR